MDPITMMAIQAGISAIPSLIQGVQGIRQNKEANELLKNTKRPDMAIPTAATESLGIARNMASSFDMPGQANAEQALNQQLAGGINNATNLASSGPEALAAAVSLYGNRMNAQNTLAGQAAQNYMGRQQNLQNQLASYADLQQAQWDWNTKQKYLADAATASAMKQAGQTNMFNAISNVAGVGANAIGGMREQQNFDKMMGITGGSKGGVDASKKIDFSPSDPIAGEAPENPVLDQTANTPFVPKSGTLPVNMAQPNTAISGGLAAAAAARNALSTNASSVDRNYNIKGIEDLNTELAKYIAMPTRMTGVSPYTPNPTLMPSYAMPPAVGTIKNWVNPSMVPSYYDMWNNGQTQSYLPTGVFNF
jgi:hypothetical protein